MPVFTRPEAVNIVYGSWRYLQREQGFRLYRYVILENDLHLVASAPTLAKAIKSFKMYTAGEIIALLERHAAGPLLRSSRALKRRHKTESVRKVEKRRDSETRFLEETGFLRTPDRLGEHASGLGGRQSPGADPVERHDAAKAGVRYNNPVKRGYVDEPWHWRHSSARN